MTLRRKLTGLAVLVASLVLLLAVLPASAGNGEPTTTWNVQPKEIAYGGGSGACSANIAGRLPSAAPYELHINNPVSGTFTGPDGTSVSLRVFGNDTKFDFTINTPAKVAFDVVVNGGAKNAHFDYDGNGGPGPQNADTGLHAPTKGNGNALYKLSHINICYDTIPVADLSVTKTPVAVNGNFVSGDPFLANVGDVVRFDIVVANAATSTVAATGVTVLDTVPSGMSLDSLTAGGTASTDSGGNTTYAWAIPSIGIGSSQTLSIYLKMDSAGQVLTNQVSVSGNETDPTPGNDEAGSVPPVTVTADISGVKFHDHDTDGERDDSQEEGLAGWTITAFDDLGNGTSATTAADGTYTIENLEPGIYTVCEATTTSGLPTSGSGFTWAWAQSLAGLANCGDYAGYEPAGYSVNLGGDVTRIDFGNHTQVTVACSETTDVTVTLGGGGTLDDPLAIVTFPAGCQSTDYTTSFDVGRSDDGDDWSQFVVFGGDATASSIVVQQTIFWDAEPALYSGGSLQVPTTQVVLAPGGTPQDVVFCSTLGGDPNLFTPQCLDYRTIAEGGPAPLLSGEIQLTEYYKFLGDPFSWRG